MTDPNGRKTTYRLTGGKFLNETTDPLGQTTQSPRAPGSNLIPSRTDALGRVTQFQYDPAGNLTQRTDALGQPWTFTYDPVFNQITSTRDPLARIIHKHGEQNGRENG